MPQFDPAVFSSQIFWLVIFFTVLMVYTVRVSVPRMRNILDERWQRTDGFKIAADRFQTEAKTIVAGNEKEIADAKAKAHTLMSQKMAEISADTSEKKKAFYDGYLANIDQAELELKKNLDAMISDVDQETVAITKSVMDKILGLDASVTDIQKHMNDNTKVMTANGN